VRAQLRSVVATNVIVRYLHAGRRENSTWGTMGYSSSGWHWLPRTFVSLQGRMNNIFTHLHGY